jgi:hypothetical protein
LIGKAVAQIRGVDPGELFAATADNLRRALPRVGAAR